MDTLATFRSRSEAIKLFNALKGKRIAASTINTPSNLKIGCGLSVMFPSSQRAQVSMLINQLGLRSFVNYFTR